MRAARLNAEAAELASVGALDDLGIAAGALSDACRVREPAVAAGYVADVAAHAQPAPARGSAFAATTAAYIAAHAAAHAVGSAHAFTAEREWQAGWLAQRLSLE